MTLAEIRSFTQQTITALNNAGWYLEAFQLSDELQGIGYRPSMAAALLVLEEAKRLAADLADPGETWASHPSLTVEERNSSLR